MLSQEQAYLIAETIPHLVWVSGPDGATQYINRRWQAYTGVSVEQAMGWQWQHAIHPDDMPRTLALWRESLRTGQPYEAEFRLRRADGKYRWHIDRALPLRDAQGCITHWFGTCTDIEGPKRAEEDLIRAHRRTAEALALLDTFIENAPVGFALVDREFRYVRVNEALAAINGLRPADHLGRHVREIVPRLWPRLESRYHQLLQGSGPLGDIELSGETAAAPGRARHWLASHYPVRIGSELLGIGVVINEVTERKRLEEQFLQAQKMEAVGRLAGGIAHDFNNLLTVINGYATMLLEDLGEGVPCAPSVRAILDAGERAAALTQQLLAFGRKQIASPRLLDLNAVVRDMGKMLRRLIGERILLTVDLQPGLGQVRADPTQVQQVVLNLAVNAADAMPQGGQLSLTTRQAERGAGGRWVMLAVTDTGCGMTGEVKAHLFEPFFTTKAVGKGTGLGLSTAYGIVRQSGGHVEVESQPGAGTTFRIYLPCVEGPAEAVISANPRTAPQGRETVLLAEDEEAVRLLARQVLQSGGYAVLEAGDGARALNLAELHGGPIDLLVTDVVMPGLGGPELAERLCASRPGLRVLYLSGYTDHGVVRDGVSQEAVHFLHKPFTGAALSQKVREVLDSPPQTEPKPPTSA
jgi:PAS domain S-box-containing protein